MLTTLKWLSNSVHSVEKWTQIVSLKMGPFSVISNYCDFLVFLVLEKCLIGFSTCYKARRGWFRFTTYVCKGVNLDFNSVFSWWLVFSSLSILVNWGHHGLYGLRFGRLDLIFSDLNFDLTNSIFYHFGFLGFREQRLLRWLTGGSPASARRGVRGGPMPIGYGFQGDCRSVIVIGLKVQNEGLGKKSKNFSPSRREFHWKFFWLVSKSFRINGSNFEVS